MILVTGGLGYIGSHTVVELINNGYEVLIADDLSNSKLEVLNCIKQITGTRPIFELADLQNPYIVNTLFDKYDIEGVIHFAAYKNVGESVNKPIEYYQNNLYSLLNILKSMKSHKVNNIIFSSSCTVYGQPDVLPVNETANIKEAWCPYGNTKQISEEIIKDVSKASNIKSILLRYFNPIGAHPSGLIGEDPVKTAILNILPIITATAIGKRSSFDVYGDDYNTPDGTCIRDYIYVVDLAKAHVIALNRLLNNTNKENVETYNLGTGVGVSVKELINTFENVSGIKLNYNIVSRRDGDVESVYGDPSKANKELNWYANTPLEYIIKTAWDWEQKINNIYKVEH